jgi:DNA-binding PadR family transcriptional regulator
MIGDLETATLAAVAQLAPNAYGVTIRARVGEILARRPPSVGSIHQVLRRLERQGLLRAQKGDPLPARGGRARRLFSITAAGAQILDRTMRQLAGRIRALAPTWRPA